MRRKRTVKPKFDTNQEGNFLINIYTEKKHFIFCSELIILLGILPKCPIEKEYDNNSRFEKRMLDYCKKNIKYCDDPKEADIFVLPTKFKGVHDSVYKNMANLSKNYNKKLLCFYNDDDDKKHDLQDNVVLYRTSFYKSSKLENEKAMTVLVTDHFDNTYQEELSISFCGTIFNKGVREKVLNILSKSDIKTDFLLRTENGNDWNKGQDIMKRKKEFFENIKNNLMVFCNRGYGNFSYRFYETLMMGRIPLLIDSDCVYPFEEEININDFCLVIDEKDISEDYLINKIKEYYTNNNLLEIQKKCRQVWEKYYSSFGFVETIIRKYTPEDENIKYLGKSINLDSQKTAIVVSSTSKFSFIWHSFFTYLRINWKNCPYQIYFTSDGESDKIIDKYNINVFQQKKDLGFLDGYRYVCEKIKHKYKYFILLQDDFLIEKKVDQETLNSYEKIMEQNSNFGFIRTMPCPGPKGERKKFENVELGRIHKHEDYSFSYQTSLWNIEYFLKFTSPSEYRWDDLNMSRKMKADKSPEENWGFIRKSSSWDSVYDSPIPYRPTAILKGKLMDWAKDLIIKE